MSWTILWKILEKLGCPSKFLTMVIQLQENQLTQARHNGMKQGCILAPTLFTTFFSMMLRQARKDLKDEDYIYIHFYNGNLFNLKCLQAHTKTLELMIIELLFVEDATLVAHSEPALQWIMFHFAETTLHFGLEVSLKKMGVLHQPAPLEEYHFPVITVGRTELKAVQQFNYLGSMISHDTKIDKEVKQTS